MAPDQNLKSEEYKLQNHTGTIWKDILSASITGADEIAERFQVDAYPVRKVIERYPVRINPYFLSLIKPGEHAIYKQVVPDTKELKDSQDENDPLFEEKQSPVPGLIHRYPGRVLFLVSNQCAVYCRFCMRKRKVGSPFAVTRRTIDAGIDYIRRIPAVREVIMSGGDPLLLEDAALNEILHRLKAIPHIDIIRIHTRAPCALPQRITEDLVKILGRYHPLFINIHFNHPDEITAESSIACNMLADAGIPLGSQTVLLKGINNDPVIMKRLMENLLKIRVRPYALHHPDPVKGTGHFRTSVKEGLAILKKLRGYVSGMCVPDYMIDLPGGGGKIPMLPEYKKKYEEKKLLIENYRGDYFDFPKK